jgi:hypothetical protein
MAQSGDEYCRTQRERILEQCKSDVQKEWETRHNALVAQLNKDKAALAEWLNNARAECEVGFADCLSAAYTDEDGNPPNPDLQQRLYISEEDYNNCLDAFDACNDAVNQEWQIRDLKIQEDYTRSEKNLAWQYLDTSNENSKINDCYRSAKQAYDQCMARRFGPIKPDLGEILIDGFFGLGDTLIRGSSEVIDSIPRLPRDKQ